MAPESLVEVLEGLSANIYRRQTEIGCQTSSSYETNMLETWKRLANDYEQALEYEKEQIILKCKAVHEEISLVCLSMGETASPQLALNPPYMSRLDECKQALATAISKAEERRQRRAVIEGHINEMTREMQLPPLDLPDLLSDAALEKWANAESELAEERSLRIRRFHELYRSLVECRHYLGTAQVVIQGQPAIDTQSMEALENECTEMQAKRSEREREVRSYESEIEELARSMDVDSALPSKSGGEGTQKRFDQLEERLHVLKMQRMEMLPQLVEKARHQWTALREAMYLDPGVKNPMFDLPPTEQLLDKLYSEISKLKADQEDPARIIITRAIDTLKRIHEYENKLKEMSGDTSALKSGGFMQRINHEAKLRSYVEKNKPEAIATLREKLGEWSTTHPEEKFYLDGVEIIKRLDEDEAASVAFKSLVASKRPLSSARLAAQRSKSDANAQSKIPTRATGVRKIPIPARPKPHTTARGIPNTRLPAGPTENTANTAMKGNAATSSAASTAAAAAHRRRTRMMESSRTLSLYQKTSNIKRAPIGSRKYLPQTQSTGQIPQLAGHNPTAPTSAGLQSMSRPPSSIHGSIATTSGIRPSSSRPRSAPGPTSTLRPGRRPLMPVNRTPLQISSPKKDQREGNFQYDLKRDADPEDGATSYKAHESFFNESQPF